jgi:hypothetical protein
MVLQLSPSASKQNWREIYLGGERNLLLVTHTPKRSAENQFGAQLFLRISPQGARRAFDDRIAGVIVMNGKRTSPSADALKCRQGSGCFSSRFRVGLIGHHWEIAWHPD